MQKKNQLSWIIVNVVILKLFNDFVFLSFLIKLHILATISTTLLTNNIYYFV